MLLIASGKPVSPSTQAIILIPVTFRAMPVEAAMAQVHCETLRTLGLELTELSENVLAV
jgi:hypothetical protein